jgi:hypothetical protein
MTSATLASMLRAAFLSASLLVVSFGFAACGDDDATPSPSDAGTDTATTTDAGADVVDAGPTFCTTQTADFCGDFDRGPTPGFGWTGVDTTGGGALALAPATDTSKPSVLRTTFPAIDESGLNAANANVAKKLPLGGKTKVTVALQANIGDTKPTSANHIVSFFTLIADRGSVALIRGQDKWFITVARRNAGPNDNTEPVLKVTPAVAKWIRLELEVVFARPSGSVKLLVDGQEAVNEAVVTLGDGQPTGDDVTLAVGPSHASGATAASESLYDDVTLKLAP